jgi:hypothetical protein
MKSHKKKIIIAGISALCILLLAVAIIFVFFPKLYTNPDSIYDFNVCEDIGYPVTRGKDGDMMCTLPNGRVIHTNFG